MSTSGAGCGQNGTPAERCKGEGSNMTVVAEPLPTPGHGGIQRTEPSRPVAQEIQSWLPEAEVILFGSRATGTWRPRSDINLAPIGISPDTDVMHTRIKRMRLLRLPTRTDRHTSRSLSLPGLILRRPALPCRTLPGTVRGPHANRGTTTSHIAGQSMAQGSAAGSPKLSDALSPCRWHRDPGRCPVPCPGSLGKSWSTAAPVQPR